ncbi:ATP-binding protein [Nocardioides sp. J54]|uniref:ATP-binding protein n=1 Tax=Nocardioides sp. J54 TaxID=935866 RepID=UPI00048FD603|nr:ATP-binding protein [Nocardioides sp. J54]
MQAWDLLRRQVLADLHPSGEPGWATTAFTRSLRRTILVGTACWQLAVVGAILVEPPSLPTATGLVAGHLLLVCMALAAVRGACPPLVVIGASHLLFVADWAAVPALGDPLMLAACWQVNLAAASPAFVLRGVASLAYPLVAAVVVPLLMVAVRPHAGDLLPLAVLGTGLAIFVVTRLGLRSVLELTRQVDCEHAEAEAAQQELEVRRVTSARAAEDGRILHDTVINTLAALANGGASVGDHDAVRARCARDVATVEAIAADDQVHLQAGIRAPLFVAGIRVRHTGIDDDELARREALLPPEVLTALAGATGELVRNAEKHSGADEVEVHVGVEDLAFVVEVSDDGVGFDGLAPEGRGLSESVVARLAEVDVDVELDTAPDRGTRVRMAWPGSTAGAAARPDRVRAPGFREVVEALQRRASGLFARGMVAVGVFLAVTNHRGQWTEDYLMVGVVAGTCAVAWWGRSSRVVVPILLALGACVAFVLSAAAVDFGRDKAFLWQAICPVGPLLMMLGTPGWHGRTPWAAGLYAATVLAVAGVVAPGSITAAVTVVVGGLVGLGLVAAWSRFQASLREVGRQAVRDQKALSAARLEAEKREAASRARRRWSAAGLRESVVLLDKVASGEIAPSDEGLRRACVEEEAYLRQLTQLNPELVAMGDWFARALAEARTSRASLVVRSGSVDVDAEVAPVLGELLLSAVSSVPSGQQVTTTLFPGPSSLRFTLVGPAPHLSAAVAGTIGERPPPGDLSIAVQTFASQDLVEVVVPAAPGPGLPTPAPRGE